MVLITALIRELHAIWRRPVDIVTSGPWSEPLLHGQPGVGDIIAVRSRKTPYWLAADQRRAVRRLRLRGPGPAWFCDANDAARPLLARAGFTDRHVVDVKDYPLRAGEHATQQWTRLAQITPPIWAHRPPPGSATGIAGCGLRADEAACADLDAWAGARGFAGAPLILIQAGNKRTMRRGPKRLAVNHKYWPLSRWAEVIRYVRKDRPQHRLVLIGTGPEFGLNQELAALANVDGLVNIADDLPIPRLLALLARASALITVDSGPAHAAAAVGCPQIVLFGTALPSLYRPWGSSGAPVLVLCGQMQGAASMLGIDTGAVIEAWTRLVPRP